MLNEVLTNAIKQANEIAIVNSHEYLGVEHILYALLQNDIFKQKLTNSGVVDIEAFTTSIKSMLDNCPKNSTATNPTLTQKLSEILNQSRMGIFSEDDFLDEIIKNKDSAVYEVLKFYGFKDDENYAKEDFEYFTTNLNQLIIDKKIDPVIGREDEIQKALQILCRHKKNNPIFVGEAGVGKTAIVHGIAQKIISGDVPEKLKNSIIFSLDITSVLAGARYRGDFEERLDNIITELKQNKNYILFIDEIHTILSASGSDNSIDIASILKPHLANDAIRCIGATTYSEFRGFNKDKALLRRFNKIDVSEPNFNDCLTILKGLCPTYEKFHNVKYSDEILALSIELAKKYLTDKFLPDSAIDIIDDAGAKLSMIKSNKKTVTKTLIIQTVSKIANIANLNPNNDSTNLKNLNKNLLQKIYGQESAINALSDALICSYAGLNEPNKPIGVFLFTGSSGVGKSELAIELSKALNVHFERFDMSEYMEQHSVSKLIGSPPGYVGFENGGLLTNCIKQHPYSVILLDEIEKAHPELINVFLQIFDNASLSDASGNKSDFKNTIIIMTSNLGTKEPNTLGFNKNPINKTDNAIRGFFSSEFRNRIDKIIHFNDLNQEILEKIVLKNINELQTTMKNKKLKLLQSALHEIIKLGYNQEFGARNIKRVIKEKISTPLAKQLLFGKLKNATNIDISFDKEFIFNIK